MGWEMRRGGLYYYHKQRLGDKVVSQYVGTGEPANLIAQMQQLSQAGIEAKRQADLIEQQDALRQEADLKAYCTQVEQILKQTLQSAGYHQHHRGEWRKKRHE